MNAKTTAPGTSVAEAIRLSLELGGQPVELNATGTWDDTLADIIANSDEVDYSEVSENAYKAWGVVDNSNWLLSVVIRDTK